MEAGTLAATAAGWTKWSGNRGAFSLFLIEFDNLFKIWYAMFIKVCGGRPAHDYRLSIILRTYKEIIFHFWLAAASAGGVSKTRTTKK